MRFHIRIQRLSHCAYGPATDLDPDTSFGMTLKLYFFFSLFIIVSSWNGKKNYWKSVKGSKIYFPDSLPRIEDTYNALYVKVKKIIFVDLFLDIVVSPRANLEIINS